LAPVYNSLFRPQLDRLVRSIVVKTAQGNNRPAAEVIAVSPFPVSDSPTDAHPVLPDEVTTCLVHQANQYARDMAPKLRDHPPILDLLALHVTWARRAKRGRGRNAPPSGGSRESTNGASKGYRGGLDSRKLRRMPGLAAVMTGAVCFSVPSDSRGWVIQMSKDTQPKEGLRKWRD
jgi:hypothetical protein